MICPKCKKDVDMLKFTTAGTMCRDCHSAERIGAVAVAGAAICSAVWNGQLLAHPFHMAIYELMGEIEKLPASEQETKVVIMAGELQNRVAALRAEAAKQAKCLREQSAECFPEENGQKHFARLIMEGVADELDAAFNPPNARADLPPTGARQPRSGTEAANGG
jgi:hypothetical protein